MINAAYIYQNFQFYVISILSMYVLYVLWKPKTGGVKKIFLYFLDFKTCIQTALIYQNFQFYVISMLTMYVYYSKKKHFLDFKTVNEKFTPSRDMYWKGL